MPIKQEDYRYYNVDIIVYVVYLKIMLDMIFSIKL
jgi:hypothetical protein